MGDSAFGYTRNVNNNAPFNLYRVPSQSPNKSANNSLPEFKNISTQEIQYRRNNGLCFKCGEKFGFGHQCKMKDLNFIVNEDEVEFSDAMGEQDEETGNSGKLMDVSLHTLSNSIKRKTIILNGFLHNRMICILVDTDTGSI